MFLAMATMLRLRDISYVYALLDACLQVGADPEAWRHQLARGVRELLAAPIAISGEFLDIYERDHARALQVVDVGWEPAQYAAYMRFQTEGGSRDDPFRVAMTARQRPLQVASAIDTLGHEAYVTSETHKRYFGHANTGDQLVAISLIAESGGERWNMTSAIRAAKDPPFGARERRLMRILTMELTPLIGSRLADSTDPVSRLTVRQHATLRLLLAGGSEAAIAAKLGIARSTLHKVVVNLFRVFDVHSRAELQARFASRGTLATEVLRSPIQNRARREGGLPMTRPVEPRSPARSRTV
jgi:DNA-binding NarL/FixJ family response regulator